MDEVFGRRLGHGAELRLRPFRAGFWVDGLSVPGRCPGLSSLSLSGCMPGCGPSGPRAVPWAVLSQPFRLHAWCESYPKRSRRASIPAMVVGHRIVRLDVGAPLWSLAPPPTSAPWKGATGQPRAAPWDPDRLAP